MDLLDLKGQKLYFEEPVPENVQKLLMQAAACYGDAEAERLLLLAFLHAPENLTVLVAMYRSFYYQHRIDEARQVARHAQKVAAQRLGLPQQWHRVNLAELSHAVLISMGLVRFYLLTLKAEAYLDLRVGEVDEGRSKLEKVVELDARDHFGAAALLDVINRCGKPTTITR